MTLPVDFAGRPVVNIYLGVGLAKSEFLLERGLPIPLPRLLHALVDTGTSRTIVEEEYLKGLELSVLSEENVHTVSSGTIPMRLNVYTVELSLAEEVTGKLANNLPVLAAADLSGLGVQMLLGRDVLSRFLFTYNGPGREFRLELVEESI